MLASVGSAPCVEQERRQIEVAVDDRLDDRRRLLAAAHQVDVGAAGDQRSRRVGMCPSRAAKCSAVMPPMTVAPKTRSSRFLATASRRRLLGFGGGQRIAVGVDAHALERHDLGRDVRIGAARRAAR